MKEPKVCQTQRHSSLEGNVSTKITIDGPQCISVIFCMPLISFASTLELTCR